MFGEVHTITCACGNKMYFPNGYYPEYFTCQNCGKFFSLRENIDGLVFPNENLNLSYDEYLKQKLEESKREKLKESLKVVK